MSNALAELSLAASACHACALRDGCRGVVFGHGPPGAKVMLVGEGPGVEEDRQGRPFVGAAGRLLDRMLTDAGFRREDLYLTNVVKCRPPANRTPARREARACWPWLREEIALVDPVFLVALGASAAAALLGPDARVSGIRGQWFSRGKTLILPTFHPAALLRDARKQPLAGEDLQQLRLACDRWTRAGDRPSTLRSYPPFAPHIY